MSARQDAIDRCREAYARNRIPWDRKLERLCNAKLHDTAEYWERRFLQRDEVAFNEPEWESPRPTTLNGTTAGARVTRESIQYHGRRADDV